MSDNEPIMDEARARMVAESIRDAQEYARRGHSIQSWLLATLVAINGAPVVAVLGSDRLGPDLVFPLGFFVGGIVLAIVSGFLSQRHADALAAINFMRGIFQRPDKFPDHYKKQYEALEKLADRLEKISNYLNYGCLLAFIVGVALSVHGISTVEGSRKVLKVEIPV